MTAGNNGADAPENDDPFGYLYRQEGQEADQPGQSGQNAPRTGGYGYPGPGTPHQPGVPRTSYNHVRAVGERTYGGQQQPGRAPQGYGNAGQPGYAQPGPGQPGYGQPGYGQQNAHYAAPETLPGGAPRQPAPARGGRGGGRGPNTKGLLIGAIAVVAVVIVGIGAAVLNNNSGDKKDQDQTGPTKQPTAAPSVEPRTPTKKPDKPAPLPTQDASGLALAGGATTASDIKGAKSEGGTYVAGINTPGASATWTVDVEKTGSYDMYVSYGVPGEDQGLTLTVNSNAIDRKIRMDNFAHAPKGDWEKGWTYTYSTVQLNKGTNTLKLSCEAGDRCNVNLDQVWLKK
ncbi:carbohydrate-binding protein [Streptomyces palmae]|uniref:Carbohydrate-binding protein n=1 Tax=Streptomyces palmae TaxID=1701085 RepID=A0A4Z0HCY8_9ACTN|nr:carbohydrate-binding protein [Streptomyces palmae]TGB12093.1 carbohydrate-binding protein [Streptomyces palmae]